MSLSMYAITVTPIVRSLTQLRQILEKAEHYAEAKKIEPSVLVNARLFPDMYPLKRQVQIASDVAFGLSDAVIKSIFLPKSGHSPNLGMENSASVFGGRFWPVGATSLLLVNVSSIYQ